MKIKKKLLIFHILLPLLVASAMYYLFCPDVFFVKLIDSLTHLNFHFSYKNTSIIGKLFRNYLFDAVWAYALTISIYTILEKENITKIIVYATLMCILLELSQLTIFVIGTFDFLDIIIEILAVFTASWVIDSSRRGKNEKT